MHAVCFSQPVVALSAVHAWTVLSFHCRQQPTTMLIKGGHDLTFLCVPTNVNYM